MHVFRPVSLLLALTTLAPAQTSLKLIPIPREVRSGAEQPLTNGVQITCAAPCSADDTFAVDDLKSYLLSQGVAVNPNSPVNILVERYGSTLSKSIYQETLPPGSAAAEMPAEIKAEGYAIIPDGKGLALTAASDAGIFYALQTVKQLVTGTGTNATLHAATIRDWPAMKYRGLDDDLSRGPITTLEFEKKMIRTIAAYKIEPLFPVLRTYAAVRFESADGAPGQRDRRRGQGVGGVCEALPRHHRAGAGGLRASAPQPDVGAVPTTRRDTAWRGIGSGAAGFCGAD